MLFQRKKASMPAPESALPGRSDVMATAENHFVLGGPLKGPFPEPHAVAMFGMGCFWGAERKFWELGPGILSTAVGYAAGFTPNPTYDELCTGQTGHNEVVHVVFDPTRISYDELLKTFWENHNPTQGMRQGNDVGTQYRSGIYYANASQKAAAEDSRARYAKALKEAGHGDVTTEVLAAPTFYYAEADHQQYLAKVPHGYCGLGGTGVSCPAGPALSS